MKKEKSLLEEYKENKIRASILKNVIGELAEQTGDIDFKLFNMSIKIQDEISKLTKTEIFMKYTTEDKKRLLDFCEQINKLFDDFIKEMNI